MDISFGHRGGRLIGSAARPGSAVRPDRLDWAGLAARLAAAHAARQVLTGRPGRHDIAAGSFSPGIAGAVAAWRGEDGQPPGQSSPAVNLEDKADGKVPRPIGRSDAGDDRFLVRGLP